MRQGRRSVWTLRGRNVRRSRALGECGYLAPATPWTRGEERSIADAGVRDANRAPSHTAAFSGSRSMLVRRVTGFMAIAATSPTSAMPAEIRKMWPVASP